jgi:hypothetical protein
MSQSTDESVFSRHVVGQNPVVRLIAMTENPYRPPSSVGKSRSTATAIHDKYHVFFLFVPIGWLLLLKTLDVGGKVSFSAITSLLLVIGTLASFVALLYAVRGWSHLAALPLWVLLWVYLVNLLVYNVRIF